MRAKPKNSMALSAASANTNGVAKRNAIAEHTRAANTAKREITNDHTAIYNAKITTIAASNSETTAGMILPARWRLKCRFYAFLHLL